MSPSSPPRPAARIALWVVMASLILGIGAYLLAGDVGAVPGDTDLFYAPVAVNLIHGQGYVLGPEFTDRYPPAFPMFLAAIFQLSGPMDTTNVLYRWIILVIQALTVGSVFLAASEWLATRPSLLAAALLAVNPVFVAFGVTRYAWNATMLFLLCFVVSFWLCVRGARRSSAPIMLAAGLARGVAVLVWPAPSWLWLIDIAFITRLRHRVVYVCGIGLIVVPWLWIVHAHTGHVALSSGLYPSMIHGAITPVGVADRGAQTSSFSSRAVAAEHDGALTSARDIAAFYLREMAARPADTVSFIARKAGRAWFASIGGAYDRAVWWSQLPFWLLGLYGAGIAWRRHRTMAWLMGSTTAYFWILSIAVLATVRYMMPALVMLSIVAAIGADDLISRAARRAA